LSSVPPYTERVGSQPPSNKHCPPGQFTFAAPKSAIPPQSPTTLSPAAFADVNTIGCFSVPCAINFDPLVITNALGSPLIIQVR